MSPFNYKSALTYEVMIFFKLIIISNRLYERN